MEFTDIHPIRMVLTNPDRASPFADDVGQPRLREEVQEGSFLDGLWFRFHRGLWNCQYSQPRFCTALFLIPVRFLYSAHSPSRIFSHPTWQCAMDVRLLGRPYNL